MWKKLLAAGCVVSLLATAPGMPVLADQIQEEKINIIGAEDSEQMAEPAGEVQEDATDEDDQSETYKPTYTVDMTNAANEEVVGEGDAVVGDGVTATFDEETGAVEFYSDGGTLWRNWTDELNASRDDIKSIRVASGTVYLPANSGGYNDSDDWEYQLFCGLDNLEEFNSFGFNTSNVTNMSFMFAYCYKLVNLDLSSFNTSSVTDMHAMFKCCSSLTALNLSCLDTSNVTDMSYMLCACGRLTDLNMSGFDKLNVTNMLHSLML